MRTNDAEVLESSYQAYVSTARNRGTYRTSKSGCTAPLSSSYSCGAELCDIYRGGLLKPVASDDPFTFSRSRSIAMRTTSRP
jgi:hypothetical protein